MSFPSYPTIAAIGENLDRINALFSPFRSRGLNPEHYDQKLKFWLKSIDEFSSVEKRMVFSVKDLEAAFKVQGRVSACFLDVMEHLRRTQTVVTETEYLQALQTHSTWLSWGARPVKSVANYLWSWTPFNSSTQKSITKETRLVYTPAVSSLASTVLLDPELQNKLMTLEEWREKVQLTVDPREIDLLLGYLSSTGSVARDKLGETEIIKLLVAAPGQTMGITAAEKGQFDITRTKEKLENDLEVVMGKIQLAENHARVALKDGQRLTAKHHLRSKKLLEKRSDKLCGLIDNLTAILFQIEDAQSDVRILAAYEAGKDALGKVLKDNNVSVDRVTNTMLDLQDALEDQAEISSTIGKGIVDDDTKLLDEELEELLRADEAADKTQPEYPNVDQNTSTEEALRELERLNLEGLDNLEEAEISKEEKSPSQI
ncbi:unnamed protein product [Allacma fusca]|uniref:Charged multivesicular body protein 7 n=1 Tax=Allacma fusca TaxID=39272 RepID=A0A8J2NGZ2_9HEXA|nr:unnamed protein product [Allacma fusca]